ncbi:MAG: Stk1 family PASTA domain-containing Ser/Thr kinase [Ruminococcaceae bacterium]|nr:Stk1 family PASTA domain-containing Ser/Thr kinase [Oscillospiraceae bacterium]
MMNGRIIGNRYEIVETVGKGGMAIVYKAKCMMLNRYVALKVLRPEFREDKDFISRFQAEAQSAASLSHPNIVSIYDVGQSGDLDYIVMEYVEGVTLKQYIEAQGVIPWREAVDYTAQICAGLEHAHKKGIIHKDIKPHNIMITREGTLKITDFGIAKVMSSSTIATGSTTMGSVHYFSPEQARGGYTDYKTDIYSLGVVLYEMLTGRLPFQGDTAIAIAMQHIEKEPTSPGEINPDIPKSLENVVARAMCKEQDMRYDSVTQMMVDLKKVYIGGSVPYPTRLTEDTVITPRVGGARSERIQDDLFGLNGKKANSKKKDVLGVIAGTLTGLALVVILFLIGYHFVGNAGVEEIELPDFKNLTLEQAEDMVVNSQLEIVVEKEEKSEMISSGKIISQSPAAGEKVKENAKVKVVISAGQGEFPMPDLVNRQDIKAQKILNEKNLQYTMVGEPSDTIPENYVVRQTPVAGTYIDSATSVTVYISTGKEQVTVEVPNMLGMSENEAKAALLDKELTWGQIIEAESSKPKGTVISQSIRAGIEVKEKTSIDLKVSAGKGGSDAPTAQPTQAPTDPPKETKTPIVIGPPNAGSAE